MKSFNFGPVIAGQITYADLIRDITYRDLRPLTDDLFETIQNIIIQAKNTDITFVPRDPQSTEGGEQGWTLGHVIAHLTATFEETAAAAAMQARGIHVEGRLRYETPWESIQTVQQVQNRLSESLRMCTAFLNAWPDTPHLDITITRIPQFGPMNAVATHMLGIIHGQTHLDQLQEVMSQIREEKA